jgi:hypothetical protein
VGKWDPVLVEGLVQAMEMKVDVINYHEDRIVAIAIAEEWGLDMGRVQDPEADAVNQDMAIAQEVTGEVDAVNQIMAIAQAEIGEVVVSKALIQEGFQDIQPMNI